MTIDFPLPPGLLLIFTALLLPLCTPLLRRLLLLAMPLVCLALVLMLRDDYVLSLSFLGYPLEPLRVTVYGRMFALIFSLMAFAGNLFALQQARTSELTAAMVYAGAAICVTLSGDLLSLFVFWEIMALGSTFVIWSNPGRRAQRAGMRYMLIHLLGGVVLMIGITGHIAATGSVHFGLLQLDSFAHWMILAGFLLNVGAPPLSAWLPDAYPEASASGSVFLSAFTTKTAVYVLMVAFAGTKLLILVGLYMVFYGIIYALLENDMRRILAYSIVNQVGFMVTGIGLSPAGESSSLALNGVAAHAFSHIIYKALLLMSAGAVLYRTGKRKCTDLGGLFQSMPATTVCGIIGALSISAFPLTSGFISKSMVSSAAAHDHYLLVWFLLTAATAGVFLHAGIKFPWFVFFQKDSGLRPADPPLNMRLAMYLFALLCLAIGIFPSLLYSLLPPLAQPYHPYTATHVLTQLQLLLFSGLAFFWLLPLMKRTLTISLDFDWFYRKAGRRLVHGLETTLHKGYQALHQGLSLVSRQLKRGRYANMKQLGLWALSIRGMVWISLFTFGITLIVVYYFSVRS